MKLQIEKWVEETKSFKEQAKDLFNESVLCYKIGTYKSAFIMSYLAFKVTIRFRIMDCMYRPKGFSEELWYDNILKDLKDDDKWEKQVNQIIETSPDAKLKTNPEVKKCIIHFENREQALNEYTYWKNVRNNCAHAKGSIIDTATVECFWNYVQDNLGKFYVLGGKEYLLVALSEFYKHRGVEENEKKRLLIHDIKTVYGSGADEYFTKFINMLIEADIDIIDENNYDFWKDIFHSEYAEIQDGIVKSISKKKSYFISFYSFFPEILELAIGIDPKFIIDKLYLWLIEWDFMRETNKYFWILLSKVLERYKDQIYIEKITREEDNMRLINYFEFEPYQAKILNENNVFKSFIINNGSWLFNISPDSQFANYSKDEGIIVKCFSYLEWDDELLKKMDNVIYELNESMKIRSNDISILNGNRFAYIYRSIVLDNKERIEEALLKLGKELKDYENILKIIQ